MNIAWRTETGLIPKAEKGEGRRLFAYQVCNNEKVKLKMVVLRVLSMVIIKFKRAGPNFILRRFAEQITYRYRYFNKNVYFANHNNC